MWILILPLSFTNFVTLGKLFNLSMPLFPPLKNSDSNNSYLIGFLGNLLEPVHVKLLKKLNLTQGKLH